MTRFIGVDVGTQQTMMAADDGEIIRTDTGSIGFPSIVSFSGKERFVGEAALQHVLSNADNTITNLTAFIGKTYEEVQTSHVSVHTKVVAQPAEGGLVAFNISYNETVRTVHTTHLLALVISNVFERAKQQYGDDIRLAIATPPGATPAERGSIVDAAHIAGAGDIDLVDSVDAVVEIYTQRYPLQAGEEQRTVLIVEMGHRCTCIALITLLPEGHAVLSQRYDAALGCLNFDMALFDRLAAKCKEKHGQEILPKTKPGLRLLAACEKFRKLLSTIPEAALHVENLVEGQDIQFTVTRDEFHEAAAPYINRFREHIAGCLAEGKLNAPVDAIELLGGGCRIPIIQSVVLEEIGVELPLGAKLDDVSVARGAAVIAKQAATRRVAVAQPATEPTEPTEPTENTENAEETASAESAKKAEQAAPAVPDDVAKELVRLSEEVRARLIEEERAMQELDREVKAMAHARNNIEAYVLEMRAAMRGKHSGLLDREKLEPMLQEYEDWLWSDEAYNAGAEQLNQKHAELVKAVEELCTAYFDAVRQEREALERQLEEESKRAEAERADEEEEDHDNRRLRKPERMRMVMKNKDEGTELFKGGNFRHAAARYQKALTHAAKFFDLSTEETAEVDAVRLSLYLNLAQCYIKLENWELVIRNCCDALAIDPNSAKAYFRRATAYEKQRDYNRAEEDAKRCQQLNPDDAMVQKMLQRLQAVLAKQKAAEKRMWQKAFA